MKKTDFPDKCSACRLLNREKMRAALEGTGNTKKSGKEKPSEYVIKEVEAKKGRGSKHAAPKKSLKKPPVPAEKPEEEEVSVAPKEFAELVKEGSKVFPKLPE